MLDVKSFPIDKLELSSGGVSERVLLVGRKSVGNNYLAQQKISVHCVADDLSDFRVAELNESIAFGASSLLGAGNFDCKDVSVLAEVGFELILVESVRKMSEIDNSILSGKRCTVGHVCLLSS